MAHVRSRQRGRAGGRDRVSRSCLRSLTKAAINHFGSVGAAAPRPTDGKANVIEDDDAQCPASISRRNGACPQMFEMLSPMRCTPSLRVCTE